MQDRKREFTQETEKFSEGIKRILKEESDILKHQPESMREFADQIAAAIKDVDSIEIPSDDNDDHEEALEIIDVMADALESVLAWRDGPEGPEVLYMEGAAMIKKCRAALAKAQPFRIQA